MKKITILIVSALFIISLIVGAKIISSASVNRNEPAYNYSYTKAICNENNYCQDNIIKCKDNNVVEITPITGAAVQFSENWKDPRDSKTINKLC